MDTELKVDLDKRTATLVLDYFTATVEDPKEKGELINNLSQVENYDSNIHHFSCI